MIEELYAIGRATSSWVWDLANSNFMTALAGAGAGAYGAQWIVERSDRKRRSLEEIRATNAATMVTFGITNTFCALKDQHVRRLKETFDKQQAKFSEFRQNQRQESYAPGRLFEFQADFETLSAPHTQIEVLQKLLFEKISVTGRPISALSTLSLSMESLSETMQVRNNVIAACKANPLTDSALAALYFGLPDANGRTDLTYPNCVSAISLYTDNCIFFSKLLMEDLVQHGRELAKAFGKSAPSIHEPNFAIALQENLIPDDKQFSEWLSAFEKQSSTPDKRKSR